MNYHFSIEKGLLEPAEIMRLASEKQGLVIKHRAQKGEDEYVASHDDEEVLQWFRQEFTCLIYGDHPPEVKFPLW